MTNMRNALKALGAVLAVVALCAPLMFLPGEDTQPALVGDAGVTLTVPTTVMVPATIPGLETTTSSTEAPSPPRPTPAATTTTTTTSGPIDITIAAAGDIPVSQALLESVRDPATDSYDFGPVLAPIAPYLSKADYAVAALEPRLGGPQPGYGASPIANAPTELAFALKQAGIDMVATANSHSLDLGWAGLVGTLDRLDSAGLAHVGTSRSEAERNTPVIVDIRGIKVAFLDYTASVAKTLPAGEQAATETTAADNATSSTTAVGKKASGKKPAVTTTTVAASTTTTTAGVNRAAYAVNMLDPATVREDAMTARSWGADVVVAMLDYGTEYAQQPSAAQEALTAEIRANGVDVILGYHARVIQPIDHVLAYASWPAKQTYVAYSLGDVLSNQEVDSPDSGMIAYLHVEKRGLRTFVTGVSYLPVYTQSSSQEAPTRYRILPVLAGIGAVDGRAAHGRRQAADGAGMGASPEPAVPARREHLPARSRRSRSLTLRSPGQVR